MKLKKNMKLGSSVYLILLIFIFSFNFSYSEDKITTSPLLNVEEIKPSFEELEEINENISSKILKEKKKYCKFRIIPSNFNRS